MKNLQKIIKYIKDSESGLSFELRDECKIAVILSDNNNNHENFATVSNHVFFITNNTSQYEQLKITFPGLKLIKGDISKTSLPDKALHGIIVDSEIINYERTLVRNELRRISLNGWSDVIIIDENRIIHEEFLEFFFAGSGYKTKVFSSDDSKNEITIYHNPIGFNEDELKSKEITEFLSACENYCNVIENYSKYTVKDFLYNVQKTLVNYYSKGFQFPVSCGGKSNLQQAVSYSERNTGMFFDLLNTLTSFLDKHDTYFSNFNPYPDDNDDNDDKDVMKMSLSCDIAEIYEDIKTNLNVWHFGNVFDRQEMIYQFKWDWQNHTGDHWTFAVRAIHWKLQELRYED